MCHRSIAKEYSVMFSRNKRNHCLQNIPPQLLQPLSSIETTGVTADYVRPSKFPIYRAIKLNFIGIQLPFPRKIELLLTPTKRICDVPSFKIVFHIVRSFDGLKNYQMHWNEFHRASGSRFYCSKFK